MSARLKIDPRTRHILEDTINTAMLSSRWSAVTDAIMSLEFEVVGVGPNGEQALCAIDPESSVKP